MVRSQNNHDRSLTMIVQGIFSWNFHISLCHKLSEHKLHGQVLTVCKSKFWQCLQLSPGYTHTAQFHNTELQFLTRFSHAPTCQLDVTSAPHIVDSVTTKKKISLLSVLTTIYVKKVHYNKHMASSFMFLLLLLAQVLWYFS